MKLCSCLFFEYSRLGNILELFYASLLLFVLPVEFFKLTHKFETTCKYDRIEYIYCFLVLIWNWRLFEILFSLFKWEQKSNNKRNFY